MSNADAPNSADAVPDSFRGYCLDCFYDLRGLPEPRCPECGRRFDPARRGTVSRTPYRDFWAALARPNPAFTRAAAGGRAHKPLSSDVARLWCENAELKRCVALLAELLIAKGVVTPSEVAEVTRIAVVSSAFEPAVVPE
ncbi:MAG TPA: hypothetical protein VEA69_15265 [Tepidisphaeraceae bacterium]|nr:hypothetical protein [Tepidisphaeraceae bacterium]